MIKFCAENKYCMTPNFVSNALQGMTHRFVLVLECETRMFNEPNKKASQLPTPPRFAIGGPRATLDPRNAKIEDLLPLVKHKLELPHGWEKVHHYIYVLQSTTDEHGWQYRSEWSNGPIRENDEPWVRTNAPNLDVRRRLWMTTVVKKEDVDTAKLRLSESLRSKQRGVIMEGELFRQEQGALMKTWQKRYCILLDDSIEIYTDAKENGGKKICELSIESCETKMLFGVQCPGRFFAFSIRHANGNLVALFDAENREIRRRWVVAIRYQLALINPEVNFPPFDYGPPTGEETATRILMCGELQKQGNVIRSWKTRFFQLTPTEIQYYDREVRKGSLPIQGGTVITDGKSLDFTLRSESGKLLTMRADTMSNKATWVRALARQILLQNERAQRAAADTAASPTESTTTTHSAPADEVSRLISKIDKQSERDAETLEDLSISESLEEANIEVEDERTVESDSVVYSQSAVEANSNTESDLALEMKRIIQEEDEIKQLVLDQSRRQTHQTENKDVIEEDDDENIVVDEATMRDLTMTGSGIDLSNIIVQFPTNTENVNKINSEQNNEIERDSDEDSDLDASADDVSGADEVGVEDDELEDKSDQVMQGDEPMKELTSEALVTNESLVQDGNENDQSGSTDIETKELETKKSNEVIESPVKSIDAPFKKIQVSSTEKRASWTLRDGEEDNRFRRRVSTSHKEDITAGNVNATKRVSSRPLSTSIKSTSTKSAATIAPQVSTFVPVSNDGPTPLQKMAEQRSLAKKRSFKEKLQASKVSNEILKWEQMSRKEDLETPW